VSDETIRQSTPRPRQRFRLGAAIAIVLVGGLILWLALRDRGGSSNSTSGSAAATAVSIQQIRNLAVSLDHPIYWLGPRQGYRYELTRSSNGNVYVRYLPPAVAVGTSTPQLTVGTYPFPGALAAIRRVLRGSGITPVRVPNGGLGEVVRRNPRSVHLAYPGSDYQIEVYDPTPGVASAAVTSGQLVDIRGFKGTGAGSNGSNGAPAAVSIADLKKLAKTLGHPLYWVGPRKGYTYELTSASNGNIYIRYLPPGVAVGTSTPELTVGTYPFPGALAAIRKVLKQSGTTRVNTPDGGVGEVAARNPRSVHLAYPGSDYQLEVFDPSPATARRLVSSGRLRTIG
jgi:hypothetical protein